MSYHIWRLGDAGADNLGLAVSEDGLLLGRTLLVERRDGRFIARERKDVERLLQSGHRLIGQANRLMHGLDVVARALNTDDPCLARIAAVRLRLPDLPSLSARQAMEQEDRLIRYEGGEWDPAKHLRTGTPPNPGWFAPAGGAAGENARGTLPQSSSSGLTRAASWLEGLSAAEIAELGSYALRVLEPVGSAAAAFGLLFIPSPNNVHVEGAVSGVPGLQYSWNRDEALLHFIYDVADGDHRTFAASIDGDKLRDEQGRTIGRVLPDGGILIESAVASPDLMKDDEPRICPAPGPDKPNERGREYEAYVKSFVNPPPNTTPSGIGFQLPNPKDAGRLVYYDDCRRTTGMMADAKGPGYDGLLTAGHSQFVPDWTAVIQEWWLESGRQIAASDGRSVRWYFAELGAAREARRLFDSDRKEGRQRIEVVFLPWSSGGR